MSLSYTIKQYHGKYNRGKRTSVIKFIVVHYTGSGSPKTGSAKANCVYFSGGNRKASAHYFIDNGSIYEYANPKQYYTWHVGDGKGKYGIDGVAITNANSIGIEVCQNGNNPYTEEEIKRLEWLVKKLMKEYNIPSKNVVMHWHASQKLCPYYYAETASKRHNQWKNLHARITSTAFSYLVKVDTESLNIRKGPGTTYEIKGTVKKGEVYTIIEEQGNWGKLKSGAGWISLNYIKKL